MKGRCYNPKAAGYSRYGQRGIKVCKRWRDSFDAFLADVGTAPPGYSLDRIDNDGHYSCGRCNECAANGWPRNVRWATAREQASNQEKNVFIEYGGERFCVSEWARRASVPITASTLWRRLFVAKWDMGKALSTPTDQHNETLNRRDRVTITIDGETYSAKEWSRISGSPYTTVYRHAKQQSRC